MPEQNKPETVNEPEPKADAEIPDDVVVAPELIKAIDDIKGFGQRTFTVDVDKGVTFTFRSLTAKDFVEIHSLLLSMKFEGLAYWFQYRIYCLARSVVDIGGLDLSTIFDRDYAGTDEETARELFLIDLFQDWDFDTLFLLFKVWRARCAIFTGKLLDDGGIKRFLSVEEQQYYENVMMMQRIDRYYAEKNIKEDGLFSDPEITDG